MRERRGTSTFLRAGASLLLLLSLFFAVSLTARAQEADAPWLDDIATTSPTRVLIVHDQGDDDKLARELATLLGHFSLTADIVEESAYQQGALQGYDTVFYLGESHRPVNPAFLDDVAGTTKTVAWMGRGLEWLDQRHPLADTYGFNYLGVDAGGKFDSVDYKGTSLVKSDPLANLVELGDGSRAEVLATMNGEGGSSPYLLHSGNLWYFADVPLVSRSSLGPAEDSAYLVLADALHDVLSQPHPEGHQALVRLEDIHPDIDVGKFNRLVDLLYQEGIPFGIALIPVYVDPEAGKEVHMSDRPEFVEAIKRAQEKGGTVVLHGYTHQLYGVTAVDHEFYDNRIGGFPRGETADSVRARVEAALSEANSQGIYPHIWETPHYNASPLAHDVFAEYFPAIWERYSAPFLPYPVRLPQTGQTIIPETLGYILGDRQAPDLLATAEKQEVVRDGYGAFFFHLQVNERQMQEMIDGLRSRGYDFVSPAEVAGMPYTPPQPPSFLSRAKWSVSQAVRPFIPESIRNPGTATVMTLLALFIILYYWGIFLLSRKPPAIDGKYDPDLHFVIVIPALNEELVLGRTLDHLLSLPQENLTILVVNDASEDHTREIVLSYPRDRVRLIDHPKSVAHQGKGRVLNYAFRYPMSSDLVREKGADKVIYGVLDADGRVKPNILEAVNPYFSRPEVGAVQVGVRIGNADTNVLTKWQNFEFLAFARLAQKAREHLGSVGLGGNGQFVRMSALASRGTDPWTDCLTEDLDLGINLMLAGWENHYCAETFISQQGVPELRPLIKQRTRWFQGHLTCWRHIPALMEREGSLSARIDTIYYLLAPLMVFLFLPSSLLFVFWSVYYVLSGALAVDFDPASLLPTIFIWYLFSFGAVPTVVWTFWREEKDMSAARAFFWAHVFAFFYVIWFVAGIKAIYRLARGEGSWVKTARTREPVAAGSRK